MMIMKMFRLLRTCVLGVFLILNAAFAYETLQGPTEVRYWDSARAFNGYTLFGTRGGTYLIDMEGRVVHTWSSIRTNPRLLENGHILDSSTDDPSRGTGFVELDWDGQAVWQYTETRADYAPHHDFMRIYNQKIEAYTTLYIANRSLTHDQAIAAGCDPAHGPYDGAQMDAIVEVDMAGNVVWEWWFFDHAVQDIDSTKANYVGAGRTIADYPGRIDLNLPGRPVKRDWLHCNSLDYDAESGHIVTNSVQGEFYVIDHDGTFIADDPEASITLAASEAGDFLYRFGDPARYEQGDTPSFLEDWTQLTMGHKQIGGTHDVQWIDAELPGAGNFLIFNNGQYIYDRTPQSYVMEINGCLDGTGQNTGAYVNPPDAGYTRWQAENRDTQKLKRELSSQIVWQYGSRSNQGFFSHIGSGCQRLPNGNTLICAMTEGHIFEVTSAGDLVWEFINPLTTDGTLEVISDQYPQYNAMFRAYRYSPDHPALAGKDLSSGQTLTGRVPSYNGPSVIALVAQDPLEPKAEQAVLVTVDLPDDETITRVELVYFLDDQANRIPMNDDGIEPDTMARDGIYSAVIPAQAKGTIVDYYIEVLDDARGETIFPAQAPGEVYEYIVRGSGGSAGADPNSSLSLPDTGQSSDHTDTKGEDSDYSLNPPSFTDNGDGTVTDNVTGLMWQQTDGGESSWEQALTYSARLALAGHSDWRLPTGQELLSIVNYDRRNPALDTEVFADTDAQYWWSSQTRVDDSDRVWVVNAGGGIGPHRKSESQSAGGTKLIHVRCVRGTQADTARHWVDNGNDTITDHTTGLTWQKNGPEAMAWEEALVYSEGLSLGGQSDWRLPNIKELRSLCDASRANPALDTTFFPDAQATPYWSSTSMVNDSAKAWTADFRLGIVSYKIKTDTSYVFCVRGGADSVPGSGNGGGNPPDDNGGGNPPGGNGGGNPPEGNGGGNRPDGNGVENPPNDNGSANPLDGNGGDDTDYGNLDRDIGLLQNAPQASPGYTLFAPKHYTMTYLMDNEGGIVNSWESDYEPGQSVHLLPNGHLLHSSFIKGAGGGTGGGEGGRIEEYDWAGNLVWEFDYYSRDYSTHHDIQPLPNGNILALVVERKSLDECLAVGFTQQALRDGELLPDSVIEIEPIYPQGGRIVWEWHVWDHLVQDNDPTKPNYGDPAEYPERISVEVNGGNSASSFWNHMNSIDYNPQLDQIMLSVRGCSELWIIDHSTTPAEAAGTSGGRWGKGGDLLYRWGNPAAYRRGDASDQMLFQQHDCQWIEPNCPGAGNILVFNNGLRRLPAGYTSSKDLPPYAVGKDWGYSSVDEIVPVMDSQGNYVMEDHGIYGPTELLWTYVAPEPTDFFAEAISGCQRLRNGNTLICDGTSGVLFEVNMLGETVWEYVCPVTGDGPIAQGDPVPLDHRAHAMNAIFKVHRYDPDYPGLADRDLVSSGPLVAAAVQDHPQLVLLPAGRFEMGDHHDLGGAEHRNDEVPVHTVSLDSFYMGKYEITNREYCAFLNSALTRGDIYVNQGLVYETRTDELCCDTFQSDGYSRIHYDGIEFSIQIDKEEHPVVGIRWLGAAAYCNWLSTANGYTPCYDLRTGVCDFTRNGFHLPTEAQWEYAGRGGQYDPYLIYPWGDDADYTKANWPGSGDPFEAGENPFTTPVGFYNGQRRFRDDFNWPGSQDSYQTGDGSNAYGLYDMAGNVWEWVNDWYHGDYYAVSPEHNPLGPEVGKSMPDGRIYHVLRSGNWYNGPEGHSRVSNRNPGYYRGPQDPDHPWYHIGFRIARNRAGVSEPSASSVTVPGAELLLLADGFGFAEGPAANAKGEVFFSDLESAEIYKLNDKGRLSVFLAESGGANGLFFDAAGNLIACQGDLGRVVSIPRERDITVLTDTYQDKRFNQPNDLWIDPAGGIYFTDPAYGTSPVQDGEHVYYISPDRQWVTRVIDDLERPNGLIGTPDGNILYIADHGSGKVFRYDIQPDASLANRTLFVAKTCDGMTMDEQGNVYITNEANVLVYSPGGELIETIEVGGQVTNVCFSGPGFSTLYITNTHELYAVDMLVAGNR